MENQNHPKHKLALEVVQNTGDRQAENDLRNKDLKSIELWTKSVKTVTEERDVEGVATKTSP